MKKISSEYRKSIEELLALYKYEPSVKDLFVEGYTDKKVLEWLLKSMSIDGVNVYEIDAVDVPTDKVHEYNYTDGNRNRVIVLSHIFAQNIGNIHSIIRCIVDKDYDYILNRSINITGDILLFTDYASLDLYFFSKEYFEKLFNFGICKCPCNISALFNCFSDILKDVFLIRAVNEGLEWHLTDIDFTKCCDINNNLIVFNRDDFIKRYLSKNSKLGDIEEFYEVFESLKQIEIDNIKNSIRGHDMISLLSWYIPKTCGKKAKIFNDEYAVETQLRCVADCDNIIKEKLFVKLHSIYS